MLRRDWRSRLRSLFPKVRTAETRGQRVVIDEPKPQAAVCETARVVGTIRNAPDAHYLWVLVRREDAGGWWPQGGASVVPTEGRWSVQAQFGEPADVGHAFQIAAALVDSEVNSRWENWVQSAERTGVWPPVQLPSSPGLVDLAIRTGVKRAAAGSSNPPENMTT